MKIVVRVGVVLLLLLVLLLSGTLLFTGSIVKSAIEHGGTWATGSATRVESASAGIVGGELELERLSIANPAGFSDQPFLRIATTRAGWDSRSLLSDRIHVREIAVDGLALRLERTAQGTNYGAILAHLERKGGEPAAPAEGGARRTLIVDRIVLTNLTADLVLADLPLASGSYSAKVPRLEIADFRSDGSTPEIVGKLLGAVLEAALSSSLEAGQGIFPKDLLTDLQKKLEGAEVLDEAKKTLKSLEPALDGLGDLFKKKP